MRAENDANCFVLSEAWDKDNQQYPVVLGLILGTVLAAVWYLTAKSIPGKAVWRANWGICNLIITP